MKTFILVFFQQLELLMKAQGLNTGFCEDIAALSTIVQPNIVNNVTTQRVLQQQQQQQQQPVIKVESEQVTCVHNIPTDLDTTVNFDDLMDDGLSADPMLSSLPVSPHMDEDSMDYITMS